MMHRDHAILGDRYIALKSMLSDLDLAKLITEPGDFLIPRRHFERNGADGSDPQPNSPGGRNRFWPQKPRAGRRSTCRSNAAC
jgi:hypothetical protein